MINLENTLTVDDLIVEYMMAKINNGYEVFYTIPEFMEFLHFFEGKMEVADVIEDPDKLFDRFFERKCASDWSNYSNSIVNPHMLRQEDKIIPTNKFSNYDRSVINTYFMTEAKREEIRTIIKEFLEEKPKRELIIADEIPKEELKIGKSVSAIMVDGIWNGYVNEYSKRSYWNWPEQCDDIYKYLLDMDLASTIKIPSIRQDVLDFYKEASLRIATLILQDYEKEAALKFVALLFPDNKLKISSRDSAYLPYSNYLCVIKGFEKLVDHGYGRYKRSFVFDLQKRNVYQHISEYRDMTTSIDDAETQKLVRALDKHSKK